MSFITSDASISLRTTIRSWASNSEASKASSTGANCRTRSAMSSEVRPGASSAGGSSTVGVCPRAEPAPSMRYTPTSAILHFLMTSPFLVFSVQENIADVSRPLARPATYRSGGFADPTTLPLHVVIPARRFPRMSRSPMTKFGSWPSWSPTPHRAGRGGRRRCGASRAAPAWTPVGTSRRPDRTGGAHGRSDARARLPPRHRAARRGVEP